MRCVSKCVVGGRTLRHYFLLVVGLIFGFSLSTLIQTFDLEALRNSAGLQVQDALSHHHREVIKISFSNLKSRDASAEDKVQEVGEYSYDREQEVNQKQGKEDGHRTVGAARDAVGANTPSASVTSSGPTQDKVNLPGAEVVGDFPLDRLSEELRTRQSLLVAVITSVRQLMTQTMSIQGTWAARTSHRVLYFVGDAEVMPHLPQGMEVVRLEGVDDELQNWELKEISTMKYLINQYLESVQWFMLIGDRTYLATERLEARLTLLDPASLVYMGLIGEEQLCRRDPGVVYSRAVLESLRAYLPMCWPGGQGGGDSLGGCLRSMGLHCTRAKEVSAKLS